MDQPKTLRLLRLLLLLAGIKRYSMRALKEKFNCSERTIFRHLEEIEAAGFIINRDNGYKLETGSQTKALQRLIHFTEEEAAILYNTLDQIEGTSSVKKALIKKLNVFYDIKILERLRHDDELEKVKVISRSMSEKKQLVLSNYRSGNSNRIENRLVEAFEFFPGYESVWCCEVSTKKIKQFKLSRMDSIAIKNSYWQYEHLHKQPFTDAFRISAAKPMATIKMVMSLKAFNLLIEEFPLSKEFIVKQGNRYHVQVKVAGFEGVGRFVLGLLDEIQVMEPLSFQKFLMKKTGAMYQTKKDFQITDRI